MGLFGDIGKVVSRGVVAVATGGLSEVARAVAPSTRPALDVVGSVLAPTSPQGIIGVGAAALTKNPAFLTSGLSAMGGQSMSQSTAPITGFVGGSPMSLNIGGLLGGLGSIFGNQTNLPAIQTVGNLASLASQFFPSPVMSQVVQTQMAPMQAMPVMAMAPMVRGAATMLTKEIFDAGLKVLQRLGVPFSASSGSFTSALKRSLGSIASLARRTPSGTMVSILAGLGLTALEANMLTAWYSQRKKGRRMNSANPRALRRAARRIRSFHKLCTTTDVLKTRSRGGSRSRYCGSCKKSPCRC